MFFFLYNCRTNRNIDNNIILYEIEGDEGILRVRIGDYYKTWIADFLLNTQRKDYYAP